MSVARTTRRRPAGEGANARSCSWSDSAPKSVRTSTSSGRPRPPSNDSTRRMSAAPARNTRTSPVSCSSACCTAAAVASAMRGDRPVCCSVGRHRISTGCVRPSLVITGAGWLRPMTPATRSVSRVADMARMRRSGRSASRVSSVKARARSVWRFRSWISSKITMPVRGSDGSRWRRRVRMPSVTTSMRVSRPTRRSSRVRYPTVPPTSSPSRSAMRRAAARAARRRGSSITIRRSSNHGSASRRSGTMVVLPAPGGAWSTADEAWRRADRSSSIVASTGSVERGSPGDTGGGPGVGIGEVSQCRQPDRTPASRLRGRSRPLARQHTGIRTSHERERSSCASRSTDVNKPRSWANGLWSGSPHPPIAGP